MLKKPYLAQKLKIKNHKPSPNFHIEQMFNTHSKFFAVSVWNHMVPPDKKLSLSKSPAQGMPSTRTG